MILLFSFSIPKLSQLFDSPRASILSSKVEDKGEWTEIYLNHFTLRLYLSWLSSVIRCFLLLSAYATLGLDKKLTCLFPDWKEWKLTDHSFQMLSRLLKSDLNLHYNTTLYETLIKNSGIQNSSTSYPIITTLWSTVFKSNFTQYSH